MNSISEPSGSRKYTLVPGPLAPKRCIGPLSIGTPQRLRCATASAIGPDPFEAKVAVARRDRKPRHFGRLHAGAVHVELLVAET